MGWWTSVVPGRLGARPPGPGGGGAPTGTVSVAVDLLRRLKGRGDDLTLAAEDLAESVGRISESTLAAADATQTAQAATGRVAEETNTVAVAAREMSAAMEDVARSSAEATQVTAEATQVTLEVRAAVERLGGSTVAIDDVVRTVNAISDQTRLLALNATIEAARAGAAGKGFAVVAEEVKNLAAETSQATAGITASLAALAADSSAVRDAVERIDEVLTRIDDLQQTIAAAVEQQSAAIAEITRSAGSAAHSVDELTESVATSTRAAGAVEESVARARTWLERLEAASWAQSQEINALGDGIDSHPLRAAIVAHAGWKKRLRTAIETRRLPDGIELATVARDDACPFGKWLHSGQAASLDPTRTATITGQHAQFHRHAAGVLTAVHNGQPDAARALMSDPAAYGGAAAALTDSLIDWIRAVERDDLTEWQERRAHPRFIIHGTVRLHLERGKHVDAELADISLGGLHCTLPAVRTTPSAIVGTVVDLTLTAPTAHGSPRSAPKEPVKARVAWTRTIDGGQLAVGVEFLHLHDAVRHWIADEGRRLPRAKVR